MPEQPAGEQPAREQPVPAEPTAAVRGAAPVALAERLVPGFGGMPARSRQVVLDIIAESGAERFRRLMESVGPASERLRQRAAADGGRLSWYDEPPARPGNGTGRAAVDVDYPACGFMVQGHWGLRGNFELLLPAAGGGVAHYWRSNDGPAYPWHRSAVFGAELGTVCSVAAAESRSGHVRRLEAITRHGPRLAHFWRDGQQRWHRTAGFATGTCGNVSVAPARAGGGLEVLVPLEGGGVAHYRRDGAVPDPWAGPVVFGRELGRVGAVALAYSGLGPKGRLDAVLRAGDRLAYYWRAGAGGNWRGPAFFLRGAAGAPALIQGRYGSKGNFEVVTPLAGGGAGHVWRCNDPGARAWSRRPDTFGDGAVLAASLVHGSLGGGPAGNLEAVTWDGRHARVFWREDVAGSWRESDRITLAGAA